MSPCHYHDYPRGWRTEIRPRILRRAGEVRDAEGDIVHEARCEECGVENHAVGVRNTAGRWHTVKDIENDSLYSDDHDYRLRALCQRDHLAYDHAEHVEHARQTRDRRSGQLPLGLAMLLFVLVIPVLADPPAAPLGGMEATTVITWSSSTPAAKFLRFPVAEADFRALASPFGVRWSPIIRVYASHAGIDIEAAVPRAQVVAAADGRVVELWPPPDGYFRGHPIYGGMVKIDHGGGMFTRYAHLSEVYVAGWQNVRGGQVIGRIGNTGQSVREHLHFEVIVNDVLQNPLLYLQLPEGGQRQ